jgi:hypothetical protein
MIVDCFPFFAPTNEEILYLRVNLLKDVVDKFIIVESNKTHSGEPVERRFLEIARNQGLPMEKIIYIEHDIPETEDLKTLAIDRINAGTNKNNIDSLYARARERLQKDACINAFNQFNDDDVFIYGDADEIINPEHVEWLANLCRSNTNVILKIPLVYLQGRADLRVHHRNGQPLIWMRAMFFATKGQIWKNGGFNNIRCGNMQDDVRFPIQDGKVIQDLGWHLAWMGTNDQRNKKARSFAHAFDKFQWMKKQDDFVNGGYEKHFNSNDPVEGGIAPDGNPGHILKRYPLDKLPKMLLDTPHLSKFFLPEVDIMKEFTFNHCVCYWCQKLDWPLMYDLDGDGKKTWFEIPRSCSVTVKESHPNRKQVSQDDPEYKNAKKPLIIFTEPVERFLSCMNVYLVPGQRYYDYGKDIFKSFDVNLDDCTKQEKIDYFFTHLNKVCSFHQVHHFHPQVRFIDFETFDEFTVINKHETSNYLGTDRVMNKTTKEINESDLTKDQLDFIRWVYREDYEFFKNYG